ncbi:Protein CBG25311 [Caenorhabditis briggsae]|uniref:Protein CBG25311 n=1 Tax=Caenorhabditis briggsae TaxID=6238 RepID=B6III1_CAEBR|nr:Protein CBG25311 [Caenorhabditis briggsae]CAR99711.1 Protein CBG25311 [Caenorhabditis briggsae]
MNHDGSLTACSLFLLIRPAFGWQHFSDCVSLSLISAHRLKLDELLPGRSVLQNYFVFLFFALCVSYFILKIDPRSFVKTGFSKTLNES